MLNASIINVDDVTSIHASMNIRASEEITIFYFDVLLPYNVWEIALKVQGFFYLYKQCELEREVSIQEIGLKDIYEVFCSTYLESIQSKVIEIRKIEWQIMHTQIFYFYYYSHSTHVHHHYIYNLICNLF